MKQWKIIILIMMFCMILINSVIACESSYKLNKNVTIIDTIVPFGEGASCNITTYNSTQGIVSSEIMERNGLSYKINLGQLPQDVYTSSIVCNLSNNYYLGECKFDVGDDFTMWEMMLAIVFGLITSIFVFLLIKTENYMFKIIYGLIVNLMIVIDLWFTYAVVKILSGNDGITSNILTMYSISLTIFKFTFSLGILILIIKTILYFKEAVKAKKRKEENFLGNFQ